MVAGPPFRGRKRLGAVLLPKIDTGLKRFRILVADQQPLFRYGAQKLFDGHDGLILAGEVDSARSLQAALAVRLPDLLVMGLRFPDGDGIELIKTLRAAYPPLPILVLSALDETVYAERVVRAGASGFIRKQEPLSELVVAVRRVVAAELYLSRKMSAVLLQQVLRCGTRGDSRGVEMLSDRELQVFQLVGAGLASRKVAKQLGISLKTVESHRENIKHKLGCSDGAELTRHAVSFVDGRGAAFSDPREAAPAPRPARTPAA